MKSVFKFALLSALIVGGRLSKQAAPATMAQVAAATPNGSVVLVHQVLTSEPVPAPKEQTQPQHSGNGLIAELF